MPENAGRETSSRALLVLAVTTVLAVLGFATAVTILQAGSPSSPNPPAPPLNWAMPTPSPAVPILPAPSAALPTGTYPQPIGTRPVRDGARPQPGTTARHSAPASRSAAAVRTSSTPPGLVVGTTIGLGLPIMPGFRVRYRDSAIDVGVITAADAPADRMDARFVTRAGRADAGCLSFESAGRPGYFLRHRDFVLRLEQATGAPLFDRDATFCPAANGDGTALRSVNYPDRHLVVAGGGIQLAVVPARWATGFQALAPL
jgi:Alpha-L-arabinofuranosidase B (ABFB) domain